MRLQHLAIIFVIIILPISLVVGEYVQMQINTISLQTLYSTKLQTATYDSISAFRLNTVNNKYSSVSDSKIRDIEAAVSSYFKSLGNEMGGNVDMKEHTPALVYTLYDGYYIYSKYYDSKKGEYDYGLKPYIYYSCRYVKGTTDIVVNYTLDNYITIYGYDGDNYITKSGNIINPAKVTNFKYDASNKIESLEYGEITIEKEVLKEQIVYIDSSSNEAKRGEYTYVIYDNNKVYYDSAVNNYFTLNSNLKKQYVLDAKIKEELKHNTKNGQLYSDSALKYYEEAYKFSKWCQTYLSEITQEHAVDENGNKITNFAYNTGSEKIFKYDGKMDITDSIFDLNRISVIRRSIQSNLLTSIANYNHLIQNTAYSYEMPVFSDEDWYKIVNNISVISFLQGIPIGTKYFNDYCVMTNNINKEVVTLDSLYAITENGEVHLPGCRDILDNKLKVTKVYKNIDFQRQTVVISEENEVYYYPHYNMKCYNCLVNTGNCYDIDYLSGTVEEHDIQTGKNIQKTVDKNTLTNLRKEVLSAMARESYDLYKINDYFKGYDESTGIDPIKDKTKTKNIEWVSTKWETIKIPFGNGNEQREIGVNKPIVTFKKGDGVSETLKIQWQVKDVTESTLSDNSKWNTCDSNILVLTNENSGIRNGSKIYLRLFDGIYDGDYMVYTIQDKEGPSETIINVYGTIGNKVILNGTETQWNWFKKDPNGQGNDSVTVEIIPGGDKQTGFGELIYKFEGAQNKQNRGSSYNIVRDYINNDGKTVITAVTYDGGKLGEFAGNTSSATYEVYKDTQCPNEPKITVTGNKNGDYYNNEELTIQFNYGTDKGPSGIDYMYYEIEYENNNNNIQQSGIIPNKHKIKIKHQGSYQIRAYMMDKAGNKSSTAINNIRQDSVAPDISLTADPVNTEGFTLNIKAKDSNSGIDKVIFYYKKDGDANYTSKEEPCNGVTTEILKKWPVTKVKQGKYWAYAEVYDRAGNKKQTTPISFSTRSIAQANSATVSPNKWTNQEVTVTFPNPPEQGLSVQYIIVENGSTVTVNNNSKWTVIKTNPAQITIKDNNTVVFYRFYDLTTGEFGKFSSITISNIDRLKPNKATITLDANNIYTTGQVKATVTHSDENATDKDGKSDIDITGCKWVFTNSKNLIGTDPSKYTNGIFSKNPQDIVFKPTEAGTYYLHVLSKDNTISTANKAPNYTETVAGPITVTLQTWTVKYDKNGGDSKPSNQTKTYGIDLKLSDGTGCSRTGYTLTGWNTSSDGKGTPYALGGTYTTNEGVTLYAQWKVKEYNITYVLNGGTNNTNNPSKYTYGKGVSKLYNPTRTGYTFKGWYTTSNFTGSKVTSISKTATGDITLYAQWEEIITPFTWVSGFRKKEKDLTVTTDSNNTTGNANAASAKVIGGVTLEINKNLALGINGGNNENGVKWVGTTNAITTDKNKTMEITVSDLKTTKLAKLEIYNAKDNKKIGTLINETNIGYYNENKKYTITNITAEKIYLKMYLTAAKGVDAYMYIKKIELKK